jgi:hypothetical protein
MIGFEKRYITVIWVMVKREVPIDVKNILAEKFRKYMRLHRGGYFTFPCDHTGQYLMHGIMPRYDEMISSVLQVAFEKYADKSDFVIHSFIHKKDKEDEGE